MRDYSHLPEWIQREIEEREARSRVATQRTVVGVLILGCFALLFAFTLIRDHLPEGW